MTTPIQFVTVPEFDLAMARIDGRFAQLEARMDARFTQVEASFTQLDGRIETRFAQLETLIERSTVTSIRRIVGLTFGLYALMFGLILFVVSRELPH